MQDISGFGLTINIFATATFPKGIVLSAFADDADAIDFPEIKVAETAMGLNGDLVGWNKAVPIMTKIAVIDGTPDEQNLSILLEANRASRGKASVQDAITATVNYPSGRQVTLSGGKITDGVPSSSVSSAGRLKTKTFGFAFEQKQGVGG